eukprot:TRINITY_DN19944_c0_g1_i1.p1 TRINITY_DN19944_c0_g1~~TRINITY_DN19944_c0_g1_i1.p1  ORF type:complete len:135 (+),score=45.25 TRINITY_DN19944_c0_g1_i1:70-474(+)
MSSQHANVFNLTGLAFGASGVFGLVMPSSYIKTMLPNSVITPELRILSVIVAALAVFSALVLFAAASNVTAKNVQLAGIGYAFCGAAHAYIIFGGLASAAKAPVNTSYFWMCFAFGCAAYCLLTPVQTTKSKRK